MAGTARTRTTTGRRTPRRSRHLRALVAGVGALAVLGTASCSLAGGTSDAGGGTSSGAVAQTVTLVTHDSFGIGEDSHPPCVHDVGGLHQHRSAGLAGLGRRLVGALDPDVGVPHRDWRCAVRNRPDRRHVGVADAAGEVLAL